MSYDYEREKQRQLISVPYRILQILPEDLAKEISKFDYWSKGRDVFDPLAASDGDVIGLLLKIRDMIDEIRALTPEAQEQAVVRKTLKSKAA
jgi:hypothetical protein